jgi:hypothetical protein
MLGRARLDRWCWRGMLEDKRDEPGLGTRDRLRSGDRRGSTQSTAVSVVIRAARHLPVSPGLADVGRRPRVVQQRIQQGQT